MSEEMEEVAADIVVSEISETGGGEKQGTLQLTKETGLFDRMLEIMEEKLEAKIDELFDAKLKKLESRLEKLSGKFSAVCGGYCQPSVDNESNQEPNVDDDHSNVLPNLFHQL